MLFFLAAVAASEDSHHRRNKLTASRSSNLEILSLVWYRYYLLTGWPVADLIIRTIILCTYKAKQQETVADFVPQCPTLVWSFTLEQEDEAPDMQTGIVDVGHIKEKKKTGSDVELAWEKSRTLSAFDSNYIAGLDPWLFKSQMKKNNYNFSIIQSDWKKIIKKGRISACKRACACSFRSLLELPSVPCPL